MPEQEYLDFAEIGDTGKTKVWEVLSRSGGYRLGRIKWHGPWRCYTFWPEPNTIWNNGCLTTVQQFIATRMAERTQKPAH